MKKRPKRNYPALAAGPVLLALALALAGCEDEGPLAPGDVGDDQDRNVYLASLSDLNGSGVRGTAAFEVDEDGNEFEAEVNVSNLANVDHPQHVHLAARCPTPADDVNGDGFVDVLEGVPAYGPILISLDDDLEDNRFGRGEFPSGTSIDYEESVDLDELLQDLRRADEDASDAVGTLGQSEGLGLEGRTVVIHGIDPGTGLPNSVQSIGGLPPHVTLPVACGTIQFR